MTESDVSSPDKRAVEAIMKYSAQLYSTRLTTKGDGVHWVKADGSFQKRTTLSLVCVSDGSYSMYAGISGVKGGRKACDWGTEGFVTSCVRSLSSRAGKALGWPSLGGMPNLAVVLVSGALSHLPIMGGVGWGALLYYVEYSPRPKNGAELPRQGHAIQGPRRVSPR